MDTHSTSRFLLRPDGDRVRVLVVDDEPDLTEVLSGALRYEGWDVRTAADGGSALDAVRAFRPDAVVLDDVGPDGSAEPGHRASCAPGGVFSSAWLRLAESTGRGPQVVLASRLGDQRLLEARGVRTLHRTTERGSVPVAVAHPATLR